MVFSTGSSIMKRVFGLVLILGLLFLVVCFRSVYTSDKIAKIIPVNPEKSLDGIPLSSLVSNVNYVFLEETSGSVIGAIDKVLVREDKYFILDREIAKGVFCFNSKGKFLFKIDDIGRGPGQNIKITDFSLGEDKIYIFDASGKKISVYSMSGGFLKAIPINASGKEFHYTQGQFLIHADYTPNADFQKNNSLFNLLVFNKEGVINSTYLPYNINVRTSLVLSGINYTFPNEDGSILVREPYSERLFRYGNSFEPAYEIDFGQKNKELGQEIRGKVLTDSNQSFESVSEKIFNSRFCELIMIAENSMVVFFAWKRQDDLHYTWFYKEDGTIVSAKRSKSDAMSKGNPLPVDNDIDGVMFMTIVGAKENSFISWTYPALIPKKDGMTIPQTDNPVLCILNYKTKYHEK